MCYSFSPAQAETFVRAKPLSELLIEPVFDAPASVIAKNSPTISAEINARIIDFIADVGDKVEDGDPLIQLECDYYQSVYKSSLAGRDELKADQKFARDQLERARSLKKNISNEARDQRENELNSITAKLRAQNERILQAKIDVDRCEIKAPFNAVVTERLTSVGELAVPGTPLIKITQLDEAEISAQISPARSSSLQASNKIWFYTEGQIYPASLDHLLPVIDTRGRTREARFTFTQESAVIGSTGRLMWQVKAAQLPAEYILQRNGKLGCFLVKDDKADFHLLDDALEGQPATIDLPPDTLIITEGRNRLQDGETIKLVD